MNIKRSPKNKKRSSKKKKRSPKNKKRFSKKKYRLSTKKVIAYSSLDVSKHTTLYSTYFDKYKAELDALGLYLFGITRFVAYLHDGHILPGLQRGTYYGSLSSLQKKTLKDIEYANIGHDYRSFSNTMINILKKKKKLEPNPLRIQQIKVYWIRYVHNRRGVSTSLSGSIYIMTRKLTLLSSTYDVSFYNTLLLPLKRGQKNDIYSYIQSYKEREQIYIRLDSILDTTNDILKRLTGKKTGGGKIFIVSQTIRYLESIWNKPI